MIDSDVPWGLINGPALIILFGYFDNENGLWKIVNYDLSYWW